MRYNSSCLEEINSEGFTPFHIAVREGKLAYVLQLVVLTCYES